MLTESLAKAALALLLLAPPSFGAGLRLTASPSQESYDQGDLVLMRVAIENMGPDTSYVYSLLSPSTQSANWPDTILVFDITKPSGRKASLIGMKIIFDHPAVTSERFREMPPLSFFGAYIPLTERQFAYDIDEPGRYRVRVHAIFNGKRWLESQKGRSKSRSQGQLLPIIRLTDYVFGGTLDSNEVSFTMRPRQR